MKAFSKMYLHWATPWPLVAALGLVLIALVSLSGAVQNFLNAEEFLVFHYANHFPHLEAWLRFSFEYGRVVETIFWTYEYKLIGYNPVLAHAISFVLVLIVAILAAKWLLNAWPREGQTRWLPYLLSCAFFINWVSLSSVLRISFDNGRISLIFFFLAGLALQRWALKQEKRLLLVSFVLFIVSLFAYENAVFLFPALVALAWPLLPHGIPARSGAQRFLALCFAGGLAGLIPYTLYRVMGALWAGSAAVPGLELSVGNMLSNLSVGSQIYVLYGQFAEFSTVPQRWLLAASLVVVLVASSALLLGALKGARRVALSPAQLGWLCIYLASVWMLLLGPLPYVLLGYAVGGRVYSSAVFGLYALLFMAHQLARPQWLRLLMIAVFVLHMVFGVRIFMAESANFLQREPIENAFFLGLKDAVPHVAADTVFILIDPPISIQGCAEGIEMLYNQYDLPCVILSSQFDKYQSIRHPDSLETDWYYLTEENWILVHIVDGTPTLLDSLSPGDFDLYLTWHSAEPLYTNYSRIITDHIPPNSPAYNHMLMRAESLFGSE